MSTTVALTEVLQINDMLAEAYGHREWKQHHDSLSELILTVLSQHTSDLNSGRAFDNLVRAFPSWEAVRDAATKEVAEAVKCAGLSRIKAPRIKEILQKISSRRGNLDISFLSELPLEDARDWLRSLPGVGPKTAACVLLFALGQPAMPVDTHVHRIVRRLGLVENKVTAEQAQEALEILVPPDITYEFHINLIAHGRKVCKAQRPLCSVCVLAQLCPSSPLSL